MAKSSIRIRAKMDGDIITVKALLTHPMETGRRKDEGGNVIPAHFIQEIVAEWKQQKVFESYWGTGVSKNPFIAFKFKGASKGDAIKIVWMDNQGNSESAETKIK